MDIDELERLEEEKRKRQEIVRESNTIEGIRQREHESKKDSLRRAFAARGEDFDAYLDKVKGTLTDMHKDGSLK